MGSSWLGGKGAGSGLGISGVDVDGGRNGGVAGVGLVGLDGGLVGLALAASSQLALTAGSLLLWGEPGMVSAAQPDRWVSDIAVGGATGLLLGPVVGGATGLLLGLAVVVAAGGLLAVAVVASLARTGNTACLAGNPGCSINGDGACLELPFVDGPGQVWDILSHLKLKNFPGAGKGGNMGGHLGVGAEAKANGIGAPGAIA